MFLQHIMKHLLISLLTALKLVKKQPLPPLRTKIGKGTLFSYGEGAPVG